MTIKNKDLIPLFNKLKKLVEPYSKYFSIDENESGYALIHKGLVDFGKYQRDEVYFVGIMIQKNYVGFYFMPQYTTDNDPQYFSKPELLKLLKGKSCYYITEKKYSEQIESQIKEALDKGFEIYRKKGWTK